MPQELLPVPADMTEIRRGTTASVVFGGVSCGWRVLSGIMGLYRKITDPNYGCTR